MNHEKLLTTNEVAKILKISYSALSKLRAKGKGPPYLRITEKGSVRYDPESLKQWIKGEIMKTKGFIVNKDADTNFTHLVGSVEVSYARLAAMFGTNTSTDDHKVSTEWIFSQEGTGIVVTLYDWKMTKLYDPDYMTIEEFRSLPSYEWHIGAKEKQHAVDFLVWFWGQNHPIKEDL
jgi:predicted DNA-binding transcriptional regulator AlpA